MSSSKSTWAGWDAADTSSALEKLENWLCKAVAKKNIIHIYASPVLTRHVYVLEKSHINVLLLINNFNISYACLFKIKNASVHTFGGRL